MPGVNGICNPKMSQLTGIFELLLRQAVALRNFRKKRPGAGEAPGRVDAFAGRLRP
jgi:hypothetical protein